MRGQDSRTDGTHLYSSPPNHGRGGLSSYALPENTGSVGSPLKVPVLPTNCEISSQLVVDEDAKKQILIRVGLNSIMKKRKVDRMLLQIASGQKIDNPLVLPTELDAEKAEVLRLAAFERNFSTSASKIHGNPAENDWNNPMWRDKKRCKFINPMHGIEYQEAMLKKQLQNQRSGVDLRLAANTTTNSFGNLPNPVHQEELHHPEDDRKKNSHKGYRLQSFFSKAKDASGLFNFGSTKIHSKEKLPKTMSVDKSLKAIQFQENYLDSAPGQQSPYLEWAVDPKTKGEIKGSSNTILMDVSSNSGFTNPPKAVKFYHKRIQSQSNINNDPQKTFQLLCDVSEKHTEKAREPNLLLYESLRFGRYPSSSKGARTTFNSVSNLRDTNLGFRRSSNPSNFRATGSSGGFEVMNLQYHSLPGTPKETKSKPSTANLKATTSASFFPKPSVKSNMTAQTTIPNPPSLHTLARAADPTVRPHQRLSQMEVQLSKTLTNNSFHPLDFAALEKRKDLRDLYTRSAVVRQYFETKLSSRLDTYPVPRVGSLPRPDLALQQLWETRQTQAQQILDCVDDMNKPSVFREEVDKVSWERQVRTVLGGGIETVSMSGEKLQRNLREGVRLKDAEIKFLQRCVAERHPQ